MQKKFFLLFLAMLLLSLGTLGGCDGSSSGNKNSTSPPSPEPPQWSSGYPDAVTVIDTVNINHQDASFKVMLDKQCTVYYVVVASGDTEPEPDQISSGLNGAGTAAFLSGNTAVPADTETAITISGLEYSQSYDIHLIAEDTDSNFQETSEMITAAIGSRNIIFVYKSGNDSNDGDDPEYPRESISAGLTAAGLLTGSCIKVYVSAGTYAESVTLEDGVSLYGGFNATDWSDRDIEDRGNATYSTAIQGVASLNFGVAFSGSSSEQWILEGFTITTSHPNSSYGVRVYLDGGTATVRYNTINGGTGSLESNGIYVNGSESKMVVQHNEINGGASSAASSNGIYIETAADQIVTDNTIDGGSGNGGTSRGIRATYPLAGTSLIARNDISGGSSNTSYGISLVNYTDNTTLACEITGNHIDGGTGAYPYGIDCTATTDGTGRAAAPLICNNVIEATGSSLGRGLYLTYTDETVRVYNNTITVSGTTNYSTGIYAMGTDVRPTTVDVQNNIMIGLSPGSGGGSDVMLYWTSSDYAMFSPVKNNVFWGAFIDSNYNTGQIATYNALSDEIDGNMVIDPVDLALDADYNFTSTSPASVTEGGLDLSGVADFPENTGGDKIDYSGTARTSPWSIGAYESD